MKANTIILGLFIWFRYVVAQRGLQCFVRGECLDSQILGATPTNNSRECWRHCQSVTGCTWFTFYKDSQICTPLSGCLRLSNEKCQDNCISGEEECPEVQCGVHGRCYGALEGIRKVGNAKECASMCGYRQECFWNTYDPEHESCLMTNDCPVLDRSCSNCSSSERDCTAEMDANMNNPNEDDSKERPSLLLSTDMTFNQNYFNVETQTAGKCELPGISPTKRVVYAAVDDDLLGCTQSEPEQDFIAFSCHKFNKEKKTWTLTDSLRVNGSIFMAFLPIPNRGMVILTASKFVYLYRGKKIRQVSDRFPFRPKNGNDNFCRTVISDDEILVGLLDDSGIFPNLTIPQLCSINIKTGTVDLIKLPNLPIRFSICGAFGPEGKRKVAIFSGNYIENGKRGRDFDLTLILDWNSKKLDADGPTLVDLPRTPKKTIVYRDTFLCYVFTDGASFIFKFDINGTETAMPFLGKISPGIMQLANIPADVVGCK